MQGSFTSASTWTNALQMALIRGQKKGRRCSASQSPYCCFWICCRYCLGFGTAFAGAIAQIPVLALFCLFLYCFVPVCLWKCPEMEEAPLCQQCRGQRVCLLHYCLAMKFPLICIIIRFSLVSPTLSILLKYTTSKHNKSAKMCVLFFFLNQVQEK